MSTKVRGQQCLKPASSGLCSPVQRKVPCVKRWSRGMSGGSKRRLWLGIDWLLPHFNPRTVQSEFLHLNFEGAAICIGELLPHAAHSAVNC